MHGYATLTLGADTATRSTIRMQTANPNSFIPRLFASQMLGGAVSPWMSVMLGHPNLVMGW